MLRHLHIRNLAVIEQASIDVGSGLNILSGETGAGKSIVVDSLALLAGERAQSDLIRSGAEMLTISGVFEPIPAGCGPLLEGAGLEPGADDGAQLVIRREVRRSGRNQVFIDDQPATLGLLAELAPFLIRIHGQRQELELGEASVQRDWLDRFAGAEVADLLDRCERGFAAYREKQQRLERASSDERLRLERIDLLTFQVGEIRGAGLQPDEDDELHAERDRLRHAETISSALAAALAALYDDDGAALERLSASRDAIGDIADWLPAAGEWSSELEELEIRLGELERTLRHQADGSDDEPRRLDEIEDRLAVVERLCRKYGGSAAAVLQRADAMQQELDELEDNAATRERLSQEAAAALEAYREVAEELSRQRRQRAGTLCEDLQAELTELAMPQARFEVEIGTRARQGSPLEIDGEAVDFGPAGWDQVTYLFSPNPGEDLRALSRVASGGELARVYLALQLLVRHGTAAEAPTFVFDEVDAGIGGHEGTVLGRKLRTLGQSRQILSVTHLPQVASHGHRHLRVIKQVRGERSFVDVEALEGEERVAEIARMLGGDTELSLSHARELLDEAAAETIAVGAGS